MKTAQASATSLLFAAASMASPVPQSGGGCSPYMMLFARGTTEQGTMGSVVGPSLQTNVQQAIPGCAVQGVVYPADFSGISSESTGSGPGSIAMASDAQSILSKCPQTKLILAGYSQGAMVVHNAAAKLGAQMSSCVGAVTFGDPFKTQLPAGLSAAKFRTFCATGDTVCGSGGTCAGTGGCASASTAQHLGYGADAGTAANFIKSAVAARAGAGTGASTGSASGTSSGQSATPSQAPTVKAPSTTSPYPAGSGAASQAGSYSNVSRKNNSH